MNDKSKRIMLTLFIVLFIVFLWDFKLTISNSTHTYKIKYTGLGWVILSHYAINKYEGYKTIGWIEYEKKQHNH
jgi:hypothetical protein